MGKIKLMQIELSTDHIYGLDEEGNVWYRDKLPYKYANTVYSSSNKKDDDNKKLWKRLSMECREKMDDDEVIDFTGGQNMDPAPVPTTSTDTIKTEETTKADSVEEQKTSATHQNAIDLTAEDYLSM